MINFRIYKMLAVFFIVFFLVSCESSVEQVIPNNDSFSTAGISKIKIENYVNRLYIDIIGRGPTDIEKTAEVDLLNENDLSAEVRYDLIERLMTDTSPSPNEGSYFEAYCNNLYLLAKIRSLNGASDDEIFNVRILELETVAYQDSLAQNWESYHKGLNEIRKYKLVLQALDRLVSGELNYHEIYGFMINNAIYDELNMNTFNFILATFDELLFRLPIVEEYDQAFDMVEFGLPSTLLGKIGNSKEDYIQILINSTAMKEGMIRWSYQVFLQRDATVGEVTTLLEAYRIDEDINQVINKILVTDEYANFY